MDLIQVIKSLKPAERLKALIAIAIITSVTALLTSYLKTDDCSQISSQYESALNSYSKTMKITNECIDESNRKTQELVTLSKILDSLSKIKMLEYSELKTSSRNQEIYPYVELVKDSILIGNNSDTSGIVVSEDKKPKIKKRKSRINTEIKSVNITESQKKLIDSANKILEKYKNID